eukprot:g15883.t1
MPDSLNTSLSFVQIAALLVLVLYLLAFFGGTALAARAAGRPVWLFGQARGLDRLAAMGFRASFALGLLAPLIWALVPGLARLDPLWSPGLSGLALPGVMPSLPGILAVLLFFIAASVQIRTEEAFLARTHGAEFEAFARRTPRWLGWPHG